MTLFIYSLAILTGSIFLILLTARLRNISAGIFLCTLTAGSILGLMSAFNILTSGTSVVYHLNVSMPLGEFYIGLDALSAFFLLAIVILFLTAGIYGYGYLKNEHRKNVSVHYALYILAFIALMLVVSAQNAILFLIAWELVTLSSYFLVIFYDERREVRDAGYLFLIATHIGAFCLWVMFILMAQHAGSMNFDQMSRASFPAALAGGIFILGIMGFGVKAGLIPLHIWLPHAHPVAPSHVSAVLSGVMIKIGIYGLMRTMMIIKVFPEWCAMVLFIIGMVSGVGGVLYALGQHEIKKLLAYHSIENIGIIVLGMAIGLWGQIAHNNLVALIGYAGALLHVFNHAIFKGLLFLSAGSVIRATHTGEIDRLGGLLKILPWTGYLFLIGSLSICGLPLFNGFISEWLVFRALFEGMFHFKMDAIIFSSLGIIALGLMGGLAAACFSKAFGTIFLGNSRSIHNADVKENPWSFRVPMAVLAGICIWIGLMPGTMVSFALGAASVVSSIEVSTLAQGAVLSPLMTLIIILMALIAVTMVLVLFKRISMKTLPVHRAQTWGCGFAHPTSRMQYTASSFAGSLLRIFRNVLGFHVSPEKPQGYFPKAQGVSSHVEDLSEDFVFRPLYEFIKSLSAQLKIIQCGYTQVYLLYIFVFLLMILIWKMV
jgi:hydrogenase-4 component B